MVATVAMVMGISALDAQSASQIEETLKSASVLPKGNLVEYKLQKVA
jgi:hypothetical protein